MITIIILSILLGIALICIAILRTRAKTMELLADSLAAELRFLQAQKENLEVRFKEASVALKKKV